MKIIGIILGLILPILLIIKPRWCADFLGNIYWKLNKLIPYSTYGTNEKSKKLFFSERILWFRVLGILWFLLIVHGFVNGNITY